MTKKEIVEILKGYYNIKITKDLEKHWLKKPKKELEDFLNECELCFGR